MKFVILIYKKYDLLKISIYNLLKNNNKCHDFLNKCTVVYHNIHNDDDSR